MSRPVVPFPGTFKALRQQRHAIPEALSKIAGGILLVATPFLLGAQSSYEVTRPNGSAVSPLQPPPGSEIYQQLQIAYRLLSLENEIAEYIAAQEWTDLQQQIESDSLTKAWGNFEDAISFAESIYGAGAKIPDVPKEPPWRDPDGVNLEILRKIIAFDARKLNLDVSSLSATPRGEKAILADLLAQINHERDRLRAALRSAAAKQPGAMAGPGIDLSKVPPACAWLADTIRIDQKSLASDQQGLASMQSMQSETGIKNWGDLVRTDEEILRKDGVRLQNCMRGR
jgi:hypothetical protein